MKLLTSGVMVEAAEGSPVDTSRASFMAAARPVPPPTSSASQAVLAPSACGVVLAPVFSSNALVLQVVMQWLFNDSFFVLVEGHLNQVGDYKLILIPSCDHCRIVFWKRNSAGVIFPPYFV